MDSTTLKHCFISINFCKESNMAHQQDYSELRLFLEKLWDRYTSVSDIERFCTCLTEVGETFTTDHIALRTVNYPEINRHALGKFFEQFGYTCANDTLKFGKKHLLADYYLPPEKNTGLPSIFISELILEDVPKELRDWIIAFTEPAVEEARHRGIIAETFLKPNWAPVHHADVAHFADSTCYGGAGEFATWFAAHGIQVNHFAASVNKLTHLSAIETVNDFLTQNGFTLNTINGVVKGVPSDLLVQSSTMSRRVSHQFAEGIFEIPGCYVEWAQRYIQPGTNELFEGFRVANATSIFDSTKDNY